MKMMPSLHHLEFRAVELKIKDFRDVPEHVPRTYPNVQVMTLNHMALVQRIIPQGTTFDSNNNSLCDLLRIFPNIRDIRSLDSIIIPDSDITTDVILPPTLALESLSLYVEKYYERRLGQLVRVFFATESVNSLRTLDLGWIHDREVHELRDFPPQLKQNLQRLRVGARWSEGDLFNVLPGQFPAFPNAETLWADSGIAGYVSLQSLSLLVEDDDAFTVFEHLSSFVRNIKLEFRRLNPPLTSEMTRREHTDPGRFDRFNWGNFQRDMQRFPLLESVHIGMIDQSATKASQMSTKLQMVLRQVLPVLSNQDLLRF
ncbi:unnamed protein product [Somion occarium]|uniref:Uncharacterized protein n=1 Tax=Somion occarium TaxID=3059160 RepID=A0ABP1DWM0_9APHY